MQLGELPYPLYHVTVTRRFSDLPAHFTARVLLLRLPSGSLEICVPLIEYLRAHRRFSDTWQGDHARALGLFWDFCVVHAELRWTPQQLFREFAIVLVEGTLSRGCAPASKRLMWPPVRLARARRLVSCMEQFAKWHSANHDTESALSRTSISFGATGNALRDLLVWGRLRRLSMLQHLKRSPAKSFRSDFRAGETIKAGKEKEPVSRFPPEYAERLLWQGYLRRGQVSEPNIFHRYSVRDMMMALLDGWGGLRRSEGLHLWTHDVQEDPVKPGHALVVLNHPQEGPASYQDPLSGAIRKTSRKNVLQRFYGLRPRNEVTRGHYHVGWKGMALNANYQSNILWVDETAAALFLVLYQGYMRFVRPAIMARRRAMGGGDHPFLFISHAVNDKTGLPGEPYSEKAYERNHQAAVLRLGLKHGKDLGTTTHGLRHLYGQTLADLHLDARVIQQGLHHTSPFSQQIYTKPSREKSNAILRNAQRNMAEGQMPTLLRQTTSDELLRLRDFVDFGGFDA